MMKQANTKRKVSVKILTTEDGQYSSAGCDFFDPDYPARCLLFREDLERGDPQEGIRLRLTKCIQLEDE
jgi:hypothetical protein